MKWTRDDKNLKHFSSNRTSKVHGTKLGKVNVLPWNLRKQILEEDDLREKAKSQLCSSSIWKVQEVFRFSSKKIASLQR